MKDSTGTVTIDQSTAVEFTWRASISKYRTADLKTHKFIISYSAGSGTWT